MENKILTVGIAIVVTVLVITFVLFSSNYQSLINFLGFSNNQYQNIENNFFDNSVKDNTIVKQKKTVNPTDYVLNPTAFDVLLKPIGIEGVAYHDLHIGEGEKTVTEGSNISVGYIGLLESGVIFDSSTQGEGINFVVGSPQVINGFSQGLIGTKVDGVRLIKLPPETAYGDNKVGTIPPNSTLYFIVTLQSIE